LTCKSGKLAKDNEIFSSGNETILLVDDESVMRTVGEQLLCQWGYTVLLAENGNRAVEIFREKKGEIDLVIMDMIMPELNGRDCFYEIKKIDPEARIILASGFSRFEDIIDLKVHGLSGFIHKPFHSSELSSAVQKALHGGKCS